MSSSGRPRTRAEQTSLKVRGDIRGWFALPRGRPPKRKPEAASTVAVVAQPAPEAAVSNAKRCKPTRGSYKSWCTGDQQDLLQAHLRGDLSDDVAVPIPRSTLYSVKQRLLKTTTPATTNSVTFLCDGRNEKGLTTEDDQREIAEIIRCRDMNNNGMCRNDAITLVMDWTGCEERGKARNHYAYLVRNKKLPDLKRDGRVVTAQKTTTKRGQITIEQQVRWHGVVESIWRDLDASNLPVEEFHPLKPHFTCNVDETCIMGSEGTLKIIGDGQRKKHNKSVEDNRDSITVVRVGNAGGNSGPLIFLAKGKTMDVPALKDLMKIGAPPHSTVIMTPSAFMTDEAWAKVSQVLAKGIRAMPVSMLCLFLIIYFHFYINAFILLYFILL